MGLDVERWEGNFKLIQNEAMMIERIGYIHNNPVKRGYVDEASH
ncbi:hypothetical protein [Sulfuricurvum sp.]|jgi:hypothetical protein|nr:hypothetical protein [Sulfuricurvum sp.]